MTNERNDSEFMEKLKQHPILKKRFQEILNIVDCPDDQFITADEAEGKAIEELKKLGQEVLTEWAINQHDKVLEKAVKDQPQAKKSIKKNSIGNPHTEK